MIIIMDIHLTNIARPPAPRYAPNFFPLNRLFGGGGPVEAQNQQQQQRNPPVHLQALPDRPHINPRDANNANQRLAELQRVHQRQAAQRQAVEVRFRLLQAARPEIREQQLQRAEDERALRGHEAINARRRVERDVEDMRARLLELEQLGDAARRANLRRLH